MSSEVVVKGEAIESDDDSDVEFESVRIKNKQSKNEDPQVEHHGTVFSGEAPESDDEILAFSSVKLGAAREMTEVYQPSPVKMVQKPILGKTLLQKLLVDRNRLLWHHLNQCVQTNVVTASSQIIAAEQLLMQSQMKLQAASRVIKEANETADHILTRFNDILTAEFLPQIKVPNNVPSTSTGMGMDTNPK